MSSQSAKLQRREAFVNISKSIFVCLRRGTADISVYSNTALKFNELHCAEEMTPCVFLCHMVHRAS